MKKGKFVLHHTKQKKGKAIYTYYMIAWYFRKNNKPFREVIKHLGVLDEDEVGFYKNSIACLNKDPGMFPCNINKVFVRNSNEYLSCAIGIHFWDYWDLSAVFPNHSNHKEVKTSDIAKILTAMRLVQNCSKTFTTKLYQETCLPQLTGVSASLYNKTRIFRELENIENHREELGKHIFNFAKQKGYTQGDILFYDLSSGNISGLRCVMAKWGHCKDGYNTHVVLLLVITAEGYPVYWELLEGNTADANTKEMIDFALIKKVKSLDLRKKSNEIREHLLQGGFKFVHENLFYKELQFSADHKKRIENITQKLNLAKRRYFLAFNPELAYLTHKHRKQRVEEYKEWVNEYNRELSLALADRKKDFEIYRLKNIIEEAFKILSNFVGIEPFYVYKNKHIQAHFTICVLSYLFDITILNKIRKSDEIDNMDLHNIFHILKKCKQDNIQLDERKAVSKITSVTEKQKKILDILNCTYLISPQYLVDKNIISIDKVVENDKRICKNALSYR